MTNVKNFGGCTQRLDRAGGLLAEIEKKRYIQAHKLRLLGIMAGLVRKK